MPLLLFRKVDSFLDLSYPIVFVDSQKTVPPITTFGICDFFIRGTMQYPISCAIIADGYNNRHGRLKKAFPPADREPIIQRLLSIFKDLFAEIILVTDRPLAYLEKDVYMASGLYSQKGHLEGIHAALFYTANPQVLVTFDDTPFLTAEVIEMVLRYGHVEKEVIMPEIENPAEPALMLFHQKSRPLLEKGIAQNSADIEPFWGEKRIHMIPEHLFRKIDPELNVFTTTQSDKFAQTIET